MRELPDARPRRREASPSLAERATGAATLAQGPGEGGRTGPRGQAPLPAPRLTGGPREAAQPHPRGAAPQPPPRPRPAAPAARAHWLRRLSAVANGAP